MRRLRPKRVRQTAREGNRDADDVLCDRAGPDAARAGDHDRARQQLRKHQTADADRGTLHPPQSRQRPKHIAIDERRERDVGLWQQTTERVAVPGFEEGVLRKLLPELVDEASRHDPNRGGTDDADEHVHRRRNVPDRPPLLNISFTSPMTIVLSTALTMS